MGRGYVELGGGGAEIPHLVQLARNTEQIKGTVLYTSAIYPVSVNGDQALFARIRQMPDLHRGNSLGTGLGECNRCRYCRALPDVQVFRNHLGTRPKRLDFHKQRV